MHKNWEKFSLPLGLLVLGLSLAFIPSLAFASKQAPVLPTPVPPEPYPNSDIYPAMVYLVTANDLQSLYDLNIDFEGVQPTDGMRDITGAFEPSLATIYINPAQSYALTKVGLTPVPIINEGFRGFLAYGPGSGVQDAWPTFNDYVARMQDLVEAHPDIVSLVQIGASVEGRGLWCMEITDTPGLDEYEPEFKYTANHHGDETTGIEMIMRLAEHLANNYGSDPLITDMIDKMEIWLCPIYNPDGYTAGTRDNANGYNLNRNYPDRLMVITDPLQPETQAFMDFEDAHRFVMGANYHGGAQVLNYL